jgi:hypothetical protein
MCEKVFSASERSPPLGMLSERNVSDSMLRTRRTKAHRPSPGLAASIYNITG